MATTAFLSTAITFTPSRLSSLASTSSSSTTSFLSRTQSLVYPHNDNAKRLLILSKAASESPPQPSLVLSKRSLSITLLTSFFFVLGGNNGVSNSNAAILEADDDEELLERVKKDRKKRIERQGVISTSNKEKGYLQDVVYKLSEVGQAIENNDLSVASSVLGGSTNSEWIKNANIAFTKLSSSPEEKTEVDTFNSSLSSLISSVTQNDVKSSKSAFVDSASAFEKWTNLTGLVAQLKGL